jgi:ElaB/YqjD/DUF883 family membrane-anchored ribosome-binding protein
MSSRTQEPADSPRTVDEARDAVEQSRQRISSTLDQLEGRIVEKKHELQDRADVLRPVRERIAERPFTTIAVAVGVGALLGSLGGESDRDDRNDRDDRDDRPRRPSRPGNRGAALSDHDRAEMRRWRKARRERLHSISRQEPPGRDDSDDGSRVGALKHQLMGAVTSAITAAVTARVREFARDSISQVAGQGRGDSHRGRDDGYR